MFLERFSVMWVHVYEAYASGMLSEAFSNPIEDIGQGLFAEGKEQVVRSGFGIICFSRIALPYLYGTCGRVSAPKAADIVPGHVAELMREFDTYGFSNSETSGGIYECSSVAGSDIA